jgi:hypothetical protein
MRFAALLAVALLIATTTAIVGVASIANARLLSRNGIPSRYQQFDVESNADDLHLHDISVDRKLYLVSLHGRSDETSYLEFAGLRLPIANREYIGWLLVFLALTMVGAFIRVPLRDRRSAAEFAGRSEGG